MSIYHHFISIKLDSWLKQTKAVVDQINNYNNFRDDFVQKTIFWDTLIFNFSVYLVLVYIITKAKTIIKYHLRMIIHIC